MCFLQINKITHPPLPLLFLREGGWGVEFKADKIILNK